MVMRYYWGLAVGHVYAHTLQRTTSCVRPDRRASQTVLSEEQSSDDGRTDVVLNDEKTSEEESGDEDNSDSTDSDSDSGDVTGHSDEEALLAFDAMYGNADEIDEF